MDFSIQKSEVPVVMGVGAPNIAATLPKGFSGYLRVKFYSGTATDQLFGIWVPINSENQPQGMGRLNSTSSSLMWQVGEEKVWILPPDGMALLVAVVGVGGFFVVDANGDIRE